MSLVFTPEGTPASPQEGEVYYDSTADKLKVRDSSAFREVVTQDATFNGTIGSSANMPSGTVIKMGQTKFTGDAYKSASGDYSGFVNAPSFTPDGGPNNTSTIYAFANLYLETAYTTGANNLKGVKFQIIGDDITNVTTSGTLVGSVDYGGSGSQVRYWFSTILQGVTLDGTGNAAITVGVAVANEIDSNQSSVTVYGNNTFDESYITFIEVV